MQTHQRIQKEFDKYDGKGKILSFTMWVQAAQDHIRVEPLKLQPLKKKKREKGRERERMKILLGTQSLPKIVLTVHFI
jgi:hypothetical protein